MVEKRQTGEGAASADEVSGPAVDREAMIREEALLDKLPEGLAPLPSVHDDLASDLLEIAERQVAEARKRLGPQSSKPKLKRIEDLFISKVGRAPRVSEELERMMRSAPSVKQTAVLDGSFDRALASALNTYDKSSIQAGATMQLAYDDWNMAVRVYKSELRASGALLAAAIEAAEHPSAPRDYDEPARTAPQVGYYSKTTKVAQALLAYEMAMQQAGTALAAAYGHLTDELYSTMDMLAVAEATLITATQTAYSTFWAGVQEAVGQPRS